VRRFHHAQIGRHRMQEQFRSRPADEQHAPGMPAEVKAWFDEQQRRHELQHPPGVAGDFAGVSSLAELETLSPEAFSRWVEAHDARALLVRRHEAVERPLPAEASIEKLHPANRVVGSVVEGDSTVQVLYRTGLPRGEDVDDERDQLAIATVRRSVEGWQIRTTLADPQLFGMENWFVSIEMPDEMASGSGRWPRRPSRGPVGFNWQAPGRRGGIATCGRGRIHVPCAAVQANADPAGAPRHARACKPDQGQAPGRRGRNGPGRSA
jgi:hypothetical protein